MKELCPNTTHGEVQTQDETTNSKKGNKNYNNKI